MAITAYEVPGRAFTTDVKGNENCTRRWKLVCDSLNPTVADVATAVGVNQYDQHPDRPEAIAQTISLTQQEGDGVVWIAEIPYSSRPFGTNQQPDDAQQAPARTQTNWETPELRPPNWSFDRKEYMRVLEFDAINVDGLGNPIRVLNSAGYPFDPPVEVPSSNLLIRIEFWKATLNLTNLRDTWDRVNNAVWQGFAARTLRVNDLSAKSTYEKAGSGGLLAFWTINLELEYKESKWNPIKILDQGTVEKVLISGNYFLRKVADDVGNPAPIPLNGGGQRLAPGADLVYLSFNGYKEIDFSTRYF